jgi:hypothetical protein
MIREILREHMTDKDHPNHVLVDFYSFLNDNILEEYTELCRATMLEF